MSLRQRVAEVSAPQRGRPQPRRPVETAGWGDHRRLPRRAGRCVAAPGLRLVDDARAARYGAPPRSTVADLTRADRLLWPRYRVMTAYSRAHLTSLQWQR
jgi:hypothetical protein